MKWIRADDLVRWAETSVASRTALSELVSSLVRASSPSPRSFRFPTVDSAQLPGYDGSLESEGAPPYIPAGASVWEFSTESGPLGKANRDYEARKKEPRAAVPNETTFIFVTPRKWPDADKWIKERNDEGFWKSVRVIDGVDLEAWLEMNPAVAARVARSLLPLMPTHGARSTEEFWDEYSSRFEPPLAEAVLLAGRAEQSRLLLQQFQEMAHSHLWQADSLEEVVAFAVATIRHADSEERKYLEARTLVLDTKQAAQQLANRSDLVFLVRAGALDLAGLLGRRSPLVVPIGRDQSSSGANVLKRPHFDELAESLKTMGLPEKRAEHLARACGRSVTILARRIPSATSVSPGWSKDRQLIPALLILSPGPNHPTRTPYRMGVAGKAAAGVSRCGLSDGETPVS